MKKWVSLAIGICAIVGYAFWVYRVESVGVVEIIIGAILAISGVIAAYILRRQ